MRDSPVTSITCRFRRNRVKPVGVLGIWPRFAADGLPSILFLEMSISAQSPGVDSTTRVSRQL
jgi:hypothetical protein